MQNKDRSIDELFDIISDLMIQMASNGYRFQMLEAVKNKNGAFAQSLKEKLEKIPEETNF